MSPRGMPKRRTVLVEGRRPTTAIILIEIAWSQIPGDLSTSEAWLQMTALCSAESNCLACAESAKHGTQGPRCLVDHLAVAWSWSVA